MIFFTFYLSSLGFLLAGALALILVLFFISIFFSSGTWAPDFEKLTTYECGFEPFSTTQGAFDIKYYLLAILFLVFDLELLYLLPWSLAFDHLTAFSLIICLYFLLVLTVAFTYEWLSGALDWQ